MRYPKDKKNPEDVEAAKRFLDFTLGWFANPIINGDYPEIMKTRVKERLPKFTEENKKMLKGSYDFFALNTYSASLEEPGTAKKQVDYWSDINTTSSVDPKWKKTDMGWSIVPEGIHDLIEYIHNTYLTGDLD